MLRSPALLGAVGALVGSPLSPPDLTRVCRDLVGLLPVDGVAITITTPGAGVRVVVAASDRMGWGWGLAQLTAGVGPGVEAAATGCTIAVDDLAADLPRWPGLGEQLAGAGIAAVAAVPLRAARLVIGTLDGYRADRHPWTAGELADLGDAARVLALALAAAPLADLDGDGDDDGTGLVEPGQVGVVQATGMVMAALGVPAADAVSRLRAAAFLQGRLITAVATDVVTGRLSATLP